MKEGLSEAALTAHAHALDMGEDGYEDPDSGLWVFTSGYLAERGYCCQSGCRHCPYGDASGPA